MFINCWNLSRDNRIGICLATDETCPGNNRIGRCLATCETCSGYNRIGRCLSTGETCSGNNRITVIDVYQLVKLVREITELSSSATVLFGSATQVIKINWLYMKRKRLLCAWFYHVKTEIWLGIFAVPEKQQFIIIITQPLSRGGNEPLMEEG